MNMPEKRESGTPFILARSSADPRDNLANVLRAFSRLREQGRLAGGDHLIVEGIRDKEHRGIDMLLDQLRVRKLVSFPGRNAGSRFRQARVIVDISRPTEERKKFLKKASEDGIPVVASFLSGDDPGPVVSTDPDDFEKIATAIFSLL